LQPLVFANRTSVPVSELTTPRQIIDPKFRGKIVIEDPRVVGPGSARVGGLLTAYGEDFVRKLFAEQHPVLTRDPRQVVEWLIRGRYPIGIGIRETILKDFGDRGLGKDVEPVTAPEAVVYNTSGGNISLLEGAPHPNAARVLINWLLSKKGQELMAELLRQNSRRTDVKPGDPDAFPDATQLEKYTRNDEAWGATHEKVIEMAKNLIK
jgi:iron(III) transport system substrate-binding protein